MKAAGGRPVKVGTTSLSCGVGGREGLGFWSQHISLWRSEDRGWSTRESPHFGPPASHTRISDRGPGHYSSPGNQRQVGEHGVMSNRRRARSTEKREESHRKNERTRNPRNDGANTVALFIIESPKHRK
ncbi:hypothetical protein CRG98_030795, partial [Punica granatum]